MTDPTIIDARIASLRVAYAALQAAGEHDLAAKVGKRLATLSRAR